MRSLNILLAATVTTISLTACGSMQPTTGTAARAAALRAAGQAAHRPQQSLGQIFTVVQNAGEWIYATLDLNKDGQVTEAEAQTVRFNSKAYDASDLNHDANVTHEEFSRWYATKVGISSAAGMRAHLAEDFVKLDADKDGFLTAAEAGVTNPAKALGHPIGFVVDGELVVECGGFEAADFKAADETKDGKLVPAEFEDLWALSIKRRLGVK